VGFVVGAIGGSVVGGVVGGTGSVGRVSPTVGTIGTVGPNVVTVVDGVKVPVVPGKVGSPTGKQAVTLVNSNIAAKINVHFCMATPPNRRMISSRILYHLPFQKATVSQPVYKKLKGCRMASL
jgi:hypothetical protein